MHEMALTQNILEILRDAALSHGFSRVTTVRLEIGALSGVEPEAMHFCFDVITKNTLAEGAILEIIRTCGTGQCLQCGQTVEVSTRFEACSCCGGYAIQITDGDTLRVNNLEVY
jgi:hydrogenase nickel incorporation protein HypA/HybF